MKPVGTNILNLGRAIALPLVGLALATPAVAQDDEPLLEEIVVVAQKREQNIMDVPVAITAVTGAQIEASGIKDVFDLQQNVPGLIVGRSQTATTSNFAIRGIGSTSNNFGVESSVGLYVDGVYRSRQSSMINELIDVYAAEVLRGPQGTLFGKNTASGAINIRTVAPPAAHFGSRQHQALRQRGSSRYGVQLATRWIRRQLHVRFRRTIYWCRKGRVQ
jgi:outer membrane receptor protein involved in Fe transport